MTSPKPRNAPSKRSPAPDVDHLISQDFSTGAGQGSPIVRLIVETSIELDETKLQDIDDLRQALKDRNGQSAFEIARRIAKGDKPLELGKGRARAVFQASLGLLNET